MTCSMPSSLKVRGLAEVRRRSNSREMSQDAILKDPDRVFGFLRVVPYGCSLFTFIGY